MGKIGRLTILRPKPIRLTAQILEEHRAARAVGVGRQALRRRDDAIALAIRAIRVQEQPPAVFLRELARFQPGDRHEAGRSVLADLRQRNLWRWSALSPFYL